MCQPSRRLSHGRLGGGRRRLLLAALAGTLLTALTGACTSSAQSPPDPAVPTSHAPAPPRETVDQRSMCPQLVPVLDRAGKIVTSYLAQPTATDRAALAETADQLTIMHGQAPEAMLKDLSTQVDTLLSIEEHLLGKRSAITNVEGFRSAGARLVAACRPYVK